MRLADLKKHLWWVLPLLVVDLVVVMALRGCFGGVRGGGCGRAEEAEVLEVVEEAPAPVVIRPLQVTFPTAQTNLWRVDDASVFMPTGSGRVESALYGSTRTGTVGGRLLPTFHEGIDIAPLTRDRRRRAMDPVVAIADGVVAYFNRVAGNSNYGIYVVVEHAVEHWGSVYSLYAHLAALDVGLRVGHRVAAGAALGRMGHTSTMGIPVERAHLHLEVALMLNGRFDAWARRERMTNPHAAFHGWNLTGIDPLALYPTTALYQDFSMPEYLAGLPVACELVVKVRGEVNYFAMYPGLWDGGEVLSGAIVLSLSEGGVILRGRPAGVEEARVLAGSGDAAVLRADRDVLGRNGARYIAERGAGWVVTSKGIQWLEILRYP